MNSQKKVLCIHGGGSNKDEMKQVLDPITSKCGQYQYVFINGPRVMDENSFHWFQGGYAIAIDAFKQVWDDSFVGIVGMSWGAVATGLVAQHLTPAPKWLVTFVSSFPQCPPSFEEDLKNIKYTGNWFSMVGEQDEGTNLLEHVNAEFTTHPGGHHLPFDNDSLQKVIDFINKQ
ncbi:hypothetical protein HDV01_006877 [Terramyces sp. JEL0728]|nr:hypothetical protein HDV01_006877 [Terramyces sp. JEL0728]